MVKHFVHFRSSEFDLHSHLAGATLGKGINRGIATFLGGASGVGVHRLASLSGIEILEPIILGISIFIFGKNK